MLDGQVRAGHGGRTGGVRRRAGLPADAAALCDSAAFMDQIKALEPASPGFGGRVATAMQTAAESDPRYRAAAPQGGVAGTAPPRQWTRDDLKGRSRRRSQRRWRRASSSIWDTRRPASGGVCVTADPRHSRQGAHPSRRQEEDAGAEAVEHATRLARGLAAGAAAAGAAHAAHAAAAAGGRTPTAARFQAGHARGAPEDRSAPGRRQDAMTETPAVQDASPAEDAARLVRAVLAGDGPGISRVVEHAEDPVKIAVKLAEACAGLMRAVSAPRVLVEQADLKMILTPMLGAWEPGVPYPRGLQRLIVAVLADPPAPEALLGTPLFADGDRQPDPAPAEEARMPDGFVVATAYRHGGPGRRRFRREAEGAARRASRPRSAPIPPRRTPSSTIRRPSSPSSTTRRANRRSTRPPRRTPAGG